MKNTTALALALTLTFATSSARADGKVSIYCDYGMLAHAEAGMVVAQNARFRETNPALQLVADELVRAAVDQLDAAKALCKSPSIEVAKANPWTEPADSLPRKPNPFDGGVDSQDDAMDPDEAAYRAVMGTDLPERVKFRGGIISHEAHLIPAIRSNP